MVRFPVKARYFYILLSVQTDCGAPNSPIFKGNEMSLPGGKWTGREIDLSLLVLRLKLSVVRLPLIRLYGVYTDFEFSLL